jgi:hypothetical protein
LDKILKIIKSSESWPEMWENCKKEIISTTNNLLSSMISILIENLAIIIGTQEENIQKIQNESLRKS